MWKIVLSGVFGGALWLLKRYFGGGVCRNNVSLKGKVVVITGGNTGMGKATALGLVQRGARVILACRSLERGDKAVKDIRKNTPEADISVRFLDLSSLNSVRNFVDNFKKTEKHLNILINNAGLYGCPHWKSEDGFEMQLAVNYLGHFLLTNLLLDTISQSIPSRIIVVTSALYKTAKINFDDLQSNKAYRPVEAYKQSKLACLLFAHELNKRLPKGVTVNSLHPGMVWTEIARYQSFNPVVKAMLYPVASLLIKTPWQGAQTSIYCATDERLDDISGQYFGDCEQQQCLPHATDDKVAEKLWEMSEKLTGLNS